MCLGGSRSLSSAQVSDRTSIPTFSVAVTCIIACLLGLINLGSMDAFNGVISVSIAGLFSSYLLTAGLLLYRRCTGAIVPLSDASNLDDLGKTADGTPRAAWGPWRIPGAMGIANNAFACAYLLFIFFFSFWPTYKNVTPKTMNWSIVVTSAVAILSAVYYAVWAKKTYHGPVIEVDAAGSVDHVSDLESRRRYT